MAKHIVVEEGVIQCAHGGKVVLKSSEGVHVIGGKKPMHDIDILGADIVGCPYNTSNGGQCTKVASISSAVTEDNVSAAGVKYLLRVDGCKTDKGAALVLLDPGQTNSVIPVKSGGSAGTPAIKELEGTELDTKENIKKERYRVYPLRRSSRQVRALRGSRNFRIIQNHFHVTASNYTHDKVITKTDAYLYVTFDNAMREFKVINRGDIFNPAILDVQFIEIGEEKKVIRRHIPFYKESGTAEFVYSNVRLKKDDLKNFKPVLFTLGDAKAACVNHHKEISKSIQHDEKALSKKTTTPDKLKESNVKYTSVLLHLDDPIGEVEDLYEEMESSFYRAYAHNKTFTDRVKERNAYAYSVAYFMDELELSSKEKKERDETKKKLKEAYYTLVDGVKDEFLPYIIDTSKNRGSTWSIKDSTSSLVRLNAFIEHDIAMSYFNEVTLNASFLLKSGAKGGRRGHRNFHYYNAFDGRKTTYLNETCIIENKTHSYLCLGKGATKYNYETNSLKQLSAENRYKDSVRENRAQITALTVFSLYFSGKHDMSLKGKYKDAAEDFHYNLKKLKAHPEFDESVQEEINDKLEGSAYTKLFKNKKGTRADNFIEDYKNIETRAKECAFEWERNDKTQLLKFANLIPRDESFNFYFQKKTTTPKQYSEQLKKKLESDELKAVLEKYTEVLIDTKDKDEIIQILNIAYSLTASRTMFDEEVNNTSAFNPKSAVMDFLIFISQRLQSVEASEHEALYKEKIFQLYHKSLHGLILHALVKGDHNEKGFSSRQDNVTKKFLDVLAPQTAKKYTLDLANLNDGNIDKELQVKQAHEKLFEQLKAIDGITSQVHGAEDKQREKEKKPGSKTTKVEEKFPTLRNSNHYKITIPALKGLSFFVALYQTGKIVKEYPKMSVSSLLELSASVNVIAKVTGEAAQATQILSTSAKAQYIFNAMKEEKLVLQRALTKLAIPIVIFGAYHEIASLDDEDYDANVAISVKTGLTIGLMLFATGIGEVLIIGIAIELLWMMLSSYFVDSKVEVLIEKSLFYQDGRKSYLLESLSSDTEEYLYKGNSKKIKDITLTQKAKDVRDFIYANYKEHKKELNAAFSYEMSSIYAALKGVKVETSSHSKQHKSSKATYAVCSYVSISKEFYKEIKRIVLLEDNKEIEIDISKHQLHRDKEFIDILTHLVISDSSLLTEYPKKDTKLLLHSDTISLKYDVIYYYDDASKYLARATGGALKIIDLKSLPLTKDDCKILNIQVS